MKTSNYFSRIICLVLLILFITTLIFMSSTSFFKNAVAEPELRKFKSEKYLIKLTIQPGDIQTIDLNFREGQALEFIYELYVWEELPINVWFLNNENYTKFIQGGEYNFFIDGSEEQVIFTTKIVSVTEYDTYKLILANKNETLPVNVDIVYEGRVYDDYSRETSSKDSVNQDTNYLLFLFIIIFIIVLALDIYFTIRKSRQAKLKESDIGSSKKSKAKKSKRKKSNKNKDRSIEKTGSKKSKLKRSKQSIPEITITTRTKGSKTKANVTYCGYCGTPVSTPFCTSCGQAKEAPVVTDISNNLLTSHQK